MKKLLLILCLFSMTAHAEWKYDGGTNTFDSYIDYSRIKTEGLYKSMWDLRDYKTTQTNASGKQYKSSVSKAVYDCQRSRSHFVAIYQYSEEMGNGAVVNSVNFEILEKDWSYPPPNSLGDGLIITACSRK